MLIGSFSRVSIVLRGPAKAAILSSDERGGEGRGGVSPCLLKGLFEPLKWCNSRYIFNVNVAKIFCESKCNYIWFLDIFVISIEDSILKSASNNQRLLRQAVLIWVVFNIVRHFQKFDPGRMDPWVSLNLLLFFHFLHFFPSMFIHLFSFFPSPYSIF